MPSIPESVLFPTGYIVCNSNIPFDDGIYNVLSEIKTTKIAIISNKCITTLTHDDVYGNRLVTWEFEYITTANGDTIHNVYRILPGMVEREMYHSSHWNLYPEQHQHKLEIKAQFDKKWNILMSGIVSTSMQGQMAAEQYGRTDFALEKTL